MDIILAGGLWLDGRAWDAVLPGLEARGHRGVPVTLPGQGDGNPTATLDDQLEAILAKVDAAADPPLVVGHSAACTLAGLTADRRPDAVAAIALIGGFPSTAGDQYAAFFPMENGGMAFPGWEPFEGPDSGDLSAEMKAEIEVRAVPVPQRVATAVVTYGDERRHTVPTFLICPEFSPKQAQEWMDSGEVPELAAQAPTLVDIDSGHWPMFSAPEALAEVLAGIADSLSPAGAPSGTAS